MGKNYVGKVKYDTVSKVDRSEAILFKVSPAERAKIRACADKYGISLSAYCRLILLNNTKILEREGVKADVH